MSKTKQYRNESSHERLLHGALYTLAELAIITGINRSTLSNRLQCVQILKDRHVRDASKMHSAEHRHEVQVIERCESRADKLSQQHLRMRLV
jgi:DNA-binding GntR family transcriptional regulator